ncbi:MULTISPECIES: NADH:flavin oxidoreductase [unclassified Ensifer]|uniref:oxidoreductase n=1 Tax=unclassified Ensifer TaxID=2633371 RepID=UPI000813834D|nr:MULTISPECIES: NADH:flavin oxidoreductase [unclassified Ensifer]OCO98940.1 NADH:flavin oxidoreductase [Ensifer sp. LC14]OCP11440.1 NADH:flavin oxidoreductase [Ensifer sp. LC13]OCP11918.1 NADH:flavin oxidoreductase [Ensifer sp. LC11]OCP33427.1 NADH:flavin oxidoreductase [Ensifer sp. LC499]
MNAPLTIPSHLFTGTSLKGLDFANRLSVAPMTRISASADGVPGDRMLAYYERFARGGFSLIATEGIYTDKAYSQTYKDQPGLTDRRQAEAWRQITDAVHSAGGRIFAQLMHGGALAQGNPYRAETVGPSAIRPKGSQLTGYHGEGPYALPREINETEIAVAIEGFANAARFAIEVSGFDGIEIHGANGYLLDQFFTDVSNRRADRWGGDIVQRLGLSLEVLKAVRAAIGPDVPLGLRVSQGKVNDFTHKWAEREEGAARVFEALAESPADFVHVTEFEAWQPAFAGGDASLVALARRHAPRLFLIANGSLHDLARAEEVVEAGADMIALGRGALVNPDLPRLAAERSGLRPFELPFLAPISDIKDSELAL